MKNHIKKIISLITCAVLLFSTLAMPSIAASSLDEQIALKIEMLSAKQDMETAHSNLVKIEDEVKANAAFTEDFEGTADKMGHRTNNNDTFIEEIVTDGDNKYAKVTVKDGAKASSLYGVDMGNGTIDNSKFAVQGATEYYIAFKYKVANYGTGNVRLYRAITDINNTTGANMNYAFAESGEWTQATAKIKTADAHSEYYFYFQILKDTGVELCLDDVMVVTITDYEKLEAANKDYQKAVADYEAAKLAYEATLSAEEIAYINAETEMIKAQEILSKAESEIKTNAAFTEDYEGTTDKMGHRTNNNDTFIEEIVTDGDNKYAKVTVKDGAKASSLYGVDMGSGTIDHSKFAVQGATEYYIAFKYKVANYGTGNVRLYRAITNINDNTGANMNYAFTESGEWTQATAKIKTADAHSEYYFYFQILKDTGVELCLDDVMVVTITDYEKLEAANKDYQKAVAAYEAAKLAYEATLSQEAIAYINAQEAMNDAKSELAKVEYEIKTNAAFTEDYEGTTDKMGHRTNNNDTFIEEIVTDGDNKYAKVTVKDGAKASSLYGVDMGNGTIDNSKFAVQGATEYYIAFKYKVANYGTGNVRLYRAITNINDNTGANMNYAFAESGEWTQATAKIKTADAHSEYYFYFQILKDTGVELCLDDVMVVTVADYEKLEAANKDYQKAVADYETAKKIYEESLVSVSPEEAAYKAAKADYEGTKNSLYTTAPFYEDYENNTNKMGFVHNNNNKIAETIYEENGNHYAGVLYTPEEISAKYGVDMNNGQTSNSTFTVEANTDYVLSFRYNLGNYSDSGYRRVYINDTFKYELNKNGIEGSSNDAVIEFNSGDKTKAHFYIMVTVDHTTIFVDDFIVLKKSDYELLNEKRRVYEEAKAIYEASINSGNVLDKEEKHLLFEHTEGQLSDFYNIGSAINAQVIVDPENSQNHIAQLTASDVDEFSFNGNNVFSKTFKDLDIGQLYIIKFDLKLSEFTNTDIFVYGGDLNKSIIDSIHTPSGASAALVNGKIMRVTTDNDGWYTYMILFNATEISATFGMMPQLNDSAKCYVDNIKLEKADDSLVADTGKIRNPSFELDSSFPYDIANNLTVELDTQNTTDGKQSLKCIGGGRIKQDVVVEPNTYYEWSFDLKFDETMAINTGATIIQPGVPSIQSATLVGGCSSSERNASAGYGYIACGDHEFNRYTLKFYTKDTTKITLTIIFRDNNKVSYLDNMVLNKVESAKYQDYEDEKIVFDIDFEDNYSTAISSKNGASKYFSRGDDGDKYLSIDAGSLGNGVAINLKDKYHKTVTSNITLEKQTTYKYTFYAKTNNTASNNFAVRHVFSKTASQYTDTKFVLGTNWQKYELYFSTTDDNVISFISFMLNSPEADQKIYIDDVRLEKVDPQIISINSEKTWIDSIANRITNGTFEKEFSDADWGTNSGLTRVVDKENALGGSAYIKIDGAVDYNRDVRVKTGRFFTFAFSYKTDVQQSDLKIGLMVDGKVMEYAVKPTVDSMIEIENTDGRWVRASYDFITPSTGCVQFVITGTGSNVIVDEICLFETALGLANDVNDYTVYEENIPLIPNIIYVDSLPEDTKPDTQPNDNNSSENITDSEDKVQTSAPADDDEPNNDDDDDDSNRKKKVVKKRKKKSNGDYQWVIWTISAVAAVVVASGIVVFIILKRKNKKGTGK